MSVAGAARSLAGDLLEKPANRARLVGAGDGQDVRQGWPERSGGCPCRRSLPTAATTSDPLPKAAFTRSWRIWLRATPRLRLITLGPAADGGVEAGRPRRRWSARPAGRRHPRSGARPAGRRRRPRRRSRAPPRRSRPRFRAGGRRSAASTCGFSGSVSGRVANSGWVRSSPESITVTGLPGPGGSTRSAPITCTHHCVRQERVARRDVVEGPHEAVRLEVQRTQPRAA